jgi:hypothetical protein
LVSIFCPDLGELNFFQVLPPGPVLDPAPCFIIFRLLDRFSSYTMGLNSFGATGAIIYFFSF